MKTILTSPEKKPATASDCMAELERLSKDKTVLLVGFTRWQLWILATAVQLALRHPEFHGESAKIAAELAGMLAGIAAPEGPLRELWVKGQVLNDYSTQGF